MQGTDDFKCLGNIFKESISEAFQEFGSWFFYENDIRIWLLHVFANRISPTLRAGIRIYTDYPAAKYDIVISDALTTNFLLACELKYFWDGFDSKSALADIQKLSATKTDQRFFICAAKTAAWLGPDLTGPRNDINSSFWVWDAPNATGRWRPLC